MTTFNIPKFKKTSSPQSIIGRVKTSYPRVRVILVPIDFTGKSRRALQYAVPVAQSFSAKVALLHVIHSDRPAGRKAAAIATVSAELTRSVLGGLEELAAVLVPAAQRGPNLVRVGGIHTEILAAARDLAADMIVLTTQGRSGMRRYFVGGIAEQLIRQATCPVLSVRCR